MRNIVGRQNCQRIGDRNAVVSAERRAVRGDHAVFQTDRQTVLLKVNRALRCLFAHHVQMSLNHDRRGIFISRRAVLEQDDVVHLVLNIAQTVLLGERDAVVADLFGVAGAVRDTADLLKIPEYRSRLESC